MAIWVSLQNPVSKPPVPNLACEICGWFFCKVRVEDCLESKRVCTICSEEFQFDFEIVRLLYDLEGPRHISEELSSMGVSPELIGWTISRIRLIATEIERNPSHRGISTIVTILNVSTIFIIPDILEESMQDVPRPIPATEEAIQKLEKVTFQDCLESTRDCIVCCEEFHQNDHVNQIVRMPCAHVYHQQCIQKWLKISHLCPLCRYKMPCSEN
ncbi:E3 ubiquitin-protein ligase RING1-like [Pistacia vera]|uniref:E3 ubiquitin-protein ligase RING1-like n=1 Tax=Pistacia vera TaxID=55513 RepID=UPI00126311EA|nr:E3 ubiquitin-protein ligase RING1-like [Pistacia vera]